MQAATKGAEARRVVSPRSTPKVVPSGTPSEVLLNPGRSEEDLAFEGEARVHLVGHVAADDGELLAGCLNGRRLGHGEGQDHERPDLRPLPKRHGLGLVALDGSGDVWRQMAEVDAAHDAAPTIDGPHLVLVVLMQAS